MAKKKIKVKPEPKQSTTVVRMGCIYKLTNLINGDSYIGKDKTGEPENHRWKHHRKMAEKGGGSYIHNAIADYGWDNFERSVIWQGSIEQLNEKEIFYIKKYRTFVGDPKYKGGYNLTPGGDGVTVWSEHAKEKMSVMFSGEHGFWYGKTRPEHSSLMVGLNNPFYGKHHTAEVRAKITNACLGREGTNKGKHLSTETKKRISVATKGRPSSRKGVKVLPSTRQLLSKALKGRHLTEAHKRNISIGVTGPKNPFYGQHWSEKDRKRLSTLAKKRRYPEAISLRKEQKLDEIICSSVGLKL